MRVQTASRSVGFVVAAMLGACSGSSTPASDAGSIGEAATDVVVPSDTGTAGADAGFDAPSTPDVGTAADAAPTTDATADTASVDVLDVPSTLDAPVAPDVPTSADVPVAADVRDATDVPRDAGADAGPPSFDIARRVPAGAVDVPVVSASASIGPAGGTITFGRAFSLRIPAGALAAPTTITVSASVRDVDVADRALSTVYTLGPSGTTFAVPAEATITAAIGASPDAVGFALRSDSGAVDHVAATRSGAAYTGRIAHFSEAYLERTGTGVALAASTCVRTPVPPAPPLFTLFAREGVARSYVRPAYVHATTTGFDVSVYAAVSATDDVRFRHFDDTGVPATPSASAVASNVFSLVRGGDFAPHRDGGSVVVYSSNVVGGLEIWARRVASDGTPMGDAVRLSNDTFLSEEPRIAATSDGFVVAWRSTDEVRGVTSIESRALTPALAVGPQVQIAVGDVIAQSTPGYFEVVSTGPLAAVAYVWRVRSAQGIRVQRVLTDGSLYGAAVEAVALPDITSLSVSYTLSATTAGDDCVLAWTTAGAPAGLRTERVSLLTGEHDTRYAYGAFGSISLAGIAQDGDGFVVAHQFVSATDTAHPLHSGMIRLDSFRAPRELAMDVGVSGTAAYPVAVAARTGGRYALAWMYAGTRDTVAMTLDDPNTLQFVQCP